MFLEIFFNAALEQGENYFFHHTYASVYEKSRFLRTGCFRGGAYRIRTDDLFHAMEAR